MTGSVDRPRIAAAVRELLAAIGEDPNRAELSETPDRVAAAYAEFFSGVGVDPHAVLQSSLMADGETAEEVILLRDIAFRSMCEHHLLPFRGRAHVAYRPGKQILGLGAIARLVETLASRLQLQERLGEQLADALNDAIAAEGVLVVLEASHGCVSDRGERQSEAEAVTVTARGSLSGAGNRAEVLALIAMDQRGTQ